MPVLVVLFLISVAGGVAAGQQSSPVVVTATPGYKAAAVDSAGTSGNLLQQAAGFLASVMAQNYLEALL